MIELLHWDAERDGPLNELTMRRRMESLGYRVSRYSYPPGCSFPPHSHAVEKLDGVLSGRFRMSMQDGSVILAAGDMLRVPKGAVHSAEVVGDDAVVSLDGVKL